MEDYQAAFLERHTDTETLKPLRKIGAMHFGGITIECLLKSIICNTVSGVNTEQLRTHSYMEILKQHNKLKYRIDNFAAARKWLDQVENPMGQHFIDLRYSGVEPDESSYKLWLYAYKSIQSWLIKQAAQL
ncbi:hypothetical protein PN497_08155 [Sphaerospermopsis kisseleviana CS-549]|uniref:Uncharacterized protein n=1 Tax=Sphaerospermopsis kisseleviana CS-549 TaxID=3021783 RepID=A0ABT4ZPK6_9CYAN|nr:hypothetical protein [Sphaerospermopsis kisseleviana]MDB9441332.1 hypothetical protein [Sphaerospermopsis kisseleviana CS-549]BAZ78945.1 hypothetical protein NIES73_01840 [Sphaerospermopsis kisseleviana NIES-73]